MCKNVLLLGPLFDKENKVPGGTVVMFNSFLQELNICKLNYKLIDTNKRNYSNLLLAVIKISAKLLSNFRKCDSVMLQSSRDYLYYLPFIYTLNLIYGKNIFLRKFGGELDKELNKRIKGKYIKFLLRNSSGIFVESLHLLNTLKQINTHTYWFPNVRSAYQNLYYKEYERKFIFVGHITPTKGIKELIEAFNILGPDYLLELYGPVMDSSLIDLIDGGTNIKYKGILSSVEVLKVISKNDFVVLPTYYPGEGYPGIIIESYSCGRPVIASNWQQIPEVVTDTQIGYLIEPKSAQAIIDMIKKIDADIFKSLCKNAFDKFHDFEASSATRKILTITFGK